MKAITDTIGKIEILHGLSENEVVRIGRKSYMFHGVAIQKIDAYTSVRYYIFIDLKNIPKKCFFESDEKITVVR